MVQQLALSHNGRKYQTLRLKNISKSFPGVRALDEVCMEFSASEVISIVALCYLRGEAKFYATQ